MTMANKIELPVHQLDVTGALFYDDIKESLFMKLIGDYVNYIGLY